MIEFCSSVNEVKNLIFRAFVYRFPVNFFASVGSLDRWNTVYSMEIKCIILGQSSTSEFCYSSEFTGTCMSGTTQDIQLVS